MVFLVDASGNVTKESLQKMRTFIRQQLPLYNISETGTRISLVAYGDRAQIKLPLSDGLTRVAVNTALDKMKKIGGERKLHLAFRAIRNDVLSTRGGARDKAGKLVVVLIGGASDPAGVVELNREGGALKDAGVKVSVIGIGAKVDLKDLEAIASGPSLVSKVDSGDHLNEGTPVVSDSAGRAAGMYCRFN